MKPVFRGTCSCRWHRRNDRDRPSECLRPGCWARFRWCRHPVVFNWAPPSYIQIQGAYTCIQYLYERKHFSACGGGLCFLGDLSPRQNKTEKQLPKHPNNSEHALKNEFCDKMAFAIHSMRNPDFRNPSRPGFDAKMYAKMIWNPARNKSETLAHGAQKVSEWVPRSHPTRTKSFSDPHGPLLLLPWLRRVLPRCQNGSPGYQKGGSRPPK